MPWDLKQTPISELAILRSLLEEFPDMGQFLPESLATKLEAESLEYLAEAKKYISDALIETGWRDKLGKLIHETTIVGTGILKGPFPKRRKLSPDIESFMSMLPGLSPLMGNVLKLRLLFQPAADYVKVENFYPDPDCGEDVQSGKFIWEKIPDQSERAIRELLEDPTYMAEQIEKVLMEKPKDKYQSDKRGPKKQSYTIWLRTGMLNLTELYPENEAPASPAFGQLTFINDKLVKVNEMPLDESLFTYWVVNYEPRPGSWAGIGVPEQIETPQRGLNTAVRAGNDNMAFSVGFMILIKEGLVEPFEGDDWTIRPYKKLRVLAEELSSLLGKQVAPEEAFKALEFPNHLDRILPWIEFWLKMAEQSSGLPLLLQGTKTSDSVGVTQQLVNNATANLRTFVSRIDNNIIGPFIQACYSWVQRYGPDTAKGEAVAFALGSAALIVRETQLQALIQFGDRVLQPAYGMSPRRYAKLFMEANQLDPERLLPDEAEVEEMKAASEKPAPMIEVAQIRAQTDLQLQQMKLELEKMKLQLNETYKTRQLDIQQDANDTAASTKVATTAMKREEVLAKQALANNGKAGGEKAPSVQKPTQEPPLDDALSILGLQ
jgi:hypothetical protein